MGKSFILLVFYLFLYINNTKSQAWTNYTKADGLLKDVVSSVAIDAQGNKWFGTWYGVTKFDGINWTSYDTSYSRNMEGVTDIAVDKQGHIVVGACVGISEFDGTTWKTYRAYRVERDSGEVCLITSVAIDTLNNRWFGTDGCGLIKFDGTTWTTYTTNKDGLPYDEVDKIAIDLQGNIWILSQYCHTEELPIPNYISKFDGTTWTHYTSDYLFGKYLTGIAIDNKGNKWIGAEGVTKFDGTNWTNYTTADGLVNNGVGTIAIDSQGNKWFGTGGGVSKFDGINWTTYINPYGEKLNSIYDIAIDTQGNKWIGTRGGVSKLSDITTEIISINENHLHLYPNPVQNVLHINLPANTGVVKVLDMFGQCLMQRQIAENENTVNVSSLRAGIYLVRVFFDNQISVSKIVKY